MKFRMAHLGYRSTPDYPYDYRIELIDYDANEQESMHDWINKLTIPCCIVGANNNVLYMREKEAMIFALKWS